MSMQPLLCRRVVFLEALNMPGLGYFSQLCKISASPLEQSGNIYRRSADRIESLLLSRVQTTGIV